MSCYEFERGNIKVPAAEWSKLKTAVRDATNSHRERVFRIAEHIHREMHGPAYQGKRGLDFRPYAFQGPFREITDRLSRNGLHDAALSDATDLLFHQRGRDDQSRPNKPTQKALEALLPAATRKTFACKVGDGAVIVFRDDTKEVVWSVDENNRACERARAHPVAEAFFHALRRITWTRGSGGAIFGNDEYNRDAGRESPGAGGSYVKDEYGPRAKAPARVGRSW